MADQTNKPGNTPERGRQDQGQNGGNRDISPDESGRTGAGTERERGTVQEPGTQPDRNRQGGGSESQSDESSRDRGGL